MKTIELFSGTKSFSKVAKEYGFETLTIDNNKELKPDIVNSILNIEFLKTDILWCSPPCTAFSVASMGKHWNKEDRSPKSDTAKFGLELLEHTIFLIKKSDIAYWYIENPRGMMRKIIDNLFKKYNIHNYRRITVSYCQYGDSRMKPTDIWTNDFKWQPKKICKNGDSCHESAPRGSKTGTQGLKNAKDRGVIPPDLFKEIFEKYKVDKNV